MDDEQLYLRALDIQDGRAHGFWVPVMQHLAMRRYPPAMVILADWYDQAGSPAASTDQFASRNLLQRAWRMGDVQAAQHMAMKCFNANDLAGFRRWARRAANLGDRDCAFSIAHFETRLSHATARKIGRHRPEAERERWA